MSYDSNIDRLTVIDLRAIAADLKIAGRSKMKRAELVAAITEAEAVNAATAEHENEEIDLTSTIDDMVSGWLPVEVASSDHNPDTAGLPAARDITDPNPVKVFTSRGNTEPVELDDRVRVDITRYDQGKADARMNDRYGFEYWAQVVRQGRRWLLIDSRNGREDFTVRAGSLTKLAKRWAKKLGVYAERIDVA